jgi:glutathione peroxidase
MKSIDGENVDLAKYTGNVLMIVNVASNCGYTGQYEQLQPFAAALRRARICRVGIPVQFACR